MSGKQQISRSALDQYIRCPRCFYMHRKLGVKPPSMVPLTLAVATDALLKNEFDDARKNRCNHDLWVREKLNVRAYQHSDIDLWRNNFKGIRIRHGSGTEIFGAVDDVWENLDTGELHIVDYKSTSKQGEPSIDVGWGDGYKRQMEIYQYLFREAGFDVNNRGFFLYVNGSKQGAFYEDDLLGVMRFSTTLIAYDGDDSWVPKAIDDAIACLNSSEIPEPTSGCDPCRFYCETADVLHQKALTAN